jgi:hypothetical protein
MTYQLFLDDIRTVKMVYPQMAESDFVIVRNHQTFKDVIMKMGLPEFISFDNDLGLDANDTLAPEGYDCAKWLVYESGLDLTHLKFHVHSANPVAKVQIESLLNNYMKHLRNL